jgi:hypothetical protein
LFIVFQVVVALNGGDLIYFEVDAQGNLNEVDKKFTGREVVGLSIAAVPSGRLRQRFLVCFTIVFLFKMSMFYRLFYLYIYVCLCFIYLFIYLFMFICFFLVFFVYLFIPSFFIIIIYLFIYLYLFLSFSFFLFNRLLLTQKIQ